MIDYTSSLYLGIKHSSTELSKWPQLTTGVPSALFEPVQSKYIGNYIAQMQNLETGLASPSTLHLYWDLFGYLSKQNITVFIDENIYPVSRYGIERLIIKNIPVYFFKHLNAEDLYYKVSSKIRRFTLPIILTDGFCPLCGKAASIDAYVSIIKHFNGQIIIDDTQAFGILGKKRDHFTYGYGGGGILQWLNISDKNIVTIISLAKAFGVPMAVISGNKDFILAFEKNSETRESSSPVSIANLNAVINAITINNKYGDEKRGRLLENILLTKKLLLESGIKLNNGVFPVQNICGLNNQDTLSLFKKLSKNQLVTVLTKNHLDHKPIITFIINYDHTVSQLYALSNTINKWMLSKQKDLLEY